MAFIKKYFETMVGFLKKNVWTIIPVIGAISGIIIVFGLPFCKGRGDTLSETYKNTECGEDLQEALLSFSQNMNMPYTIGPDDYKIIFDEGEIQKEYYRDGVNYTAYFHLNQTETGCYLKLYKMGQTKPGIHEINIGNYGSVILEKCQCNGEKGETDQVLEKSKSVSQREDPREGINYIWLDLGKKDTGLFLTLALNVEDGITEPDVKAGVDCKKLPFPYDGPGHNHMYFDINDTFLRGGNNEVWIVMEYFDRGRVINCQYDSDGRGPVDGAFRGADDGAFPILELTNTDTWKFHVWHIRDGRFMNRGNGYDFRFSTHTRGSMWVNRVWLFLYEPPEPFNPDGIFPC